MSRVPAWLFIAIFTLSGFSGLIYESIWSHYLKLMLGHSAYAQTLVLAIFMGGMAVGSWLSGRYAGRISNALLAYAAAEFAVGVLALVFHPVFTSVNAWTFDSLIPALGQGWMVDLSKWTVGALLILPSSILLGSTFPLMSTAIMRIYGDGQGRVLPALYFANSFGAAIGVLAAGFILIQKVGLPGAVFSAGLVNIALSIGCWALWKALPEQEPAHTRLVGESRQAGFLFRLCLIMSCVTGLASFMYEVAWIRMLSMAIGASTHSFEVMLSAFILGIAIGGGLLVFLRRRGIPSHQLLINIIMAKIVCAVAAIAVYPELLDLVKWLYQALSQSENGYTLYLMGSYTVAGLMMMPTAICAGMVLPLLTQMLLENGGSEGVVGKIYATNTLGAILGTMIATHLGMELLGLKGITVAGALLELVVLFVFVLGPTSLGPVKKTAVLVTGTILALGIPAFTKLDTLKMASGIFRFGEFMDPNEYQLSFYKDGKTASVAVVGDANFKEIRTNGKTDAAIAISASYPPFGDEHTMWMLSLLPQLHVPEARSILNIGFGSGLTTHVSMGNPKLVQVDTIEIERAMIEGAKEFMPFNRLAFEDPRSRIIIDDAKTFLASSGNRYDIIISEPSNPWVSGVASLFTREYYRVIASRLNQGGVLAQWIQLYDTDPKILASIITALESEFEDYAMYLVHRGDAVIIASPKGKVPPASKDLFAIEAWRTGLGRLGYSDAMDIRLLEAGRRDLLGPLMRSYGMTPNSDYFPIVDQLAPLARFKGRHVAYFDELNQPVVSLRALQGKDFGVSLKELLIRAEQPRRSVATQRAVLAAMALSKLSSPGERIEPELPSQVRYGLALHHASVRQCEGGMESVWLESQEAIAMYVAGWVAADDIARVLSKSAADSKCRSKLTPLQETRLNFAHGVAARDKNLILEASRKLIAQPLDPQYAKMHEKTIMTAYISALAASGGFAEAAEYVKSREQNPLWRSDLNLRLALAHIELGILGKK